jgi:hypothetical protein
MNKYIIYFLFVSLFVFISCSSNRNREKELQGKIENIIFSATSDTISFDLTKNIDVEWEYFIVIPPYTIIDRLEDSINVNLEELKRTGIQYIDHFDVVCFINKGTISSYYTDNFYFSKLVPFHQYNKNVNLLLAKTEERYFIELKE